MTRTGRELWWIGGVVTVCSVMGVTIVAAGPLAGLLAAAVAFSAVTGLAASMRSGLGLLRMVMTRPASSRPDGRPDGRLGHPRPEGIERWLPLNGYWLRLFFGTPGVMLIWGLLWMVMSACVLLALCICALPILFVAAFPGR